MHTFFKDLRSGDPSVQRSMAYAIGALRYDLNPQLAQSAIEALSQMFEKKVTLFKCMKSGVC